MTSEIVTNNPILASFDKLIACIEECKSNENRANTDLI